MTDLVVESKIRIPRRRHAHVDRPRLLQRLGRVTDVPLTLVSAPAGFGKTTLLTEWLATGASTRTEAAWLALDAGDNDPVVFWRYVVAAVHAVAPDAARRAGTLLEAAQVPTSALLPVLLNDLGTLSEDLVVVLDDVHVVESGEVREQLTIFLERLPPRVHVVLAGRADPALPLARWRARGDLVEVRAADLRFGPDETATYLTEVMGLHLSAADLATLEERTEGWIAALQLAGLSMQGRQDVSRFISGFAGDDRFVVDYLVEEVLQRQPDDIRRFLLRTSVLSRMEGSVCDAVVGRAGSHAVLASLERGNLFVVPLDDRRGAYRYHHLFGDVLRARLLDEHAAEVPELHRRAGLWYEQHGQAGEAIRHALAGGDVDRAADLMERAMPSLVRSRQEATLRAWLESLPEEVLRVRPVLGVGYVGTLLVRGDVDGVDRRLRDVEHWLGAVPGDAGSPQELPVVVDRAAFADLPAAVAVYRSGQALLGGDLTATVEHARRVLDVSREDDHVARGSAAGLLGLAHWHAGALEEAHRWYAGSIAHLRTAGHLPDALGCSLALADIEVAQGRLDDALGTLRSGLQLGTAHDPPLRGTADMHVGLSRLLGERGELEAAWAHLHAAQRLGEHVGLPQNPYRWRLEHARLQEAVGELQAALASLDEADRVFTTDFSPDVRPLAAVRARLHLAQGEVGLALTWARARRPAADDELTYVDEFERLTLVRVLLATGRSGRREHLAEAMALLDRLEAAAQDGGRPGSVIEVRALRALGHQVAGDDRSAVVTLRDAVVAAEAQGYVRVFTDEGAPMAELLRALAARAGAPDHVRRLLRRAGGGDRRATAPQTLVDPLSARELEVLRLLTTDLDGPGVARALVVSTNTLRTHTRNIYAKLGVNSRRAAVTRAEQLGLLGHTPVAERA